MKIVQLITRMDTIGGAQIHVRDLSVALKRAGHDVYLITGGERCEFVSVIDNGIPVIFLKSLSREINPVKDVKALLEVRNILKEINPDIIASHSSKAGIIGRIAGRSLGIPVVFTAHGWSFTEGIPAKKRRIYKMVEKIVGVIAKGGVITVSDYDRQLAINEKVVPENKIITIHNGIEDTFHEHRASPEHSPPIFIMVARFNEPKNQQELINAMERLGHFEWKLYLVGDGPLQQKAEDLTKKMGLTERVVFWGSRMDVMEILAKSQVFVLISDWEGLPISIIEAMRCGLPVIATDVGGIKEIVKDGVNGFLVQKKNESELVEKLAILMSNPELRSNMGNQGRQIYEHSFIFERMFSKTVAYYQESVSQKFKKDRG